MAAGHRHIGMERSDVERIQTTCPEEGDRRGTSNVGAPDVVGSSVRQIPQQIGTFPVAVIREAGARLAPDPFVADLAAKPLHVLAVDIHAVVALEDIHQFAAAKARIDPVDLVQQALGADVLRVLGIILLDRLRAGDSEEFTLFSHAQFGFKTRTRPPQSKLKPWP
jgi:hypothetical protein